jgi:hypothetical protein
VRYPSRNVFKDVRKVTIALGILATDGIVIAADRQIGVSQYMKLSQGKIAFAKSVKDGKGASFAIAGAGTVSYLEAFSQLEMDKFHSHAGLDMAEYSKTIQDGFDEFYRRHVEPFMALGSNRPDISLLVGVEDGVDRRLWYTENNLLVPSLQYCAIGSGGSSQAF